MTPFDVAVGLDEAAMSQAMAAVYRELYPRVFTGSQRVEKAGLEFVVSWDVKAPPTVVLGPPPEGRHLLARHLRTHLEPLRPHRRAVDRRLCRDTGAHHVPGRRQ